VNEGFTDKIVIDWDAEWLVEGPVPVTVTTYDPGVAVPAVVFVVIVAVALPEGCTEVGLISHAGGICPVCDDTWHASTTVPVKPVPATTEMAEEDCCPGSIAKGLNAAMLSEKSWPVADGSSIRKAAGTHNINRPLRRALSCRMDGNEGNLSMNSFDPTTFDSCRDTKAARGAGRKERRGIIHTIIAKYGAIPPLCLLRAQ
jgi:hypothetical protein